jgi:hypothetical protein
VLLLLLLLLGITLSLPSVQTKLGQYLTEQINKDFGTDINVEQVTVSIFGGVKLKEVMIRDHHKDTLFYINRLKTNILSFKQLYEGNLIFGDIRADGLVANLKTYKNETHTNIDLFIEAFDDGKPSSGKFLMTVDNIYLTNSRFILIDENRAVPKDVDFTKLNGRLINFKIKGSNVTTQINDLAFFDHRGVEVTKLNSKFSYSKTQIDLQDLNLLTTQSLLVGDLVLKYNVKDFSDFNNRVVFEARVDTASLSTNDIRYFYKELEKNNHFNFTANLNGTLNKLSVTNLNLVDNKNSIIKGDVLFENLFGKTGQNFFMDGNFDKISSNYQNLTDLLPNVLGKKLPSALRKLGNFNFEGIVKISPSAIDTEFKMATALGTAEADLKMGNIQNIDNANYDGYIILNNFNIGSLLNRKDIGRVTLDLNVKGKGFTEKTVDTHFNGNINKLYYNGYNYSKIIVDGNFKKPIFEGKVNVNDPNLFMDFNGGLDISASENVYNFEAKIDYANLKQLQFVKDSISILKGNIVTNLKGNSIDNLHGTIHINQASYQNNKDIYVLDDFELTSTFNETIERTLTINSPDIFEGKVVGKFQFSQLQKMIENSLGSLYTNYHPNKVAKGQYLNFNFSIFNKVIEIFLPDISISSNTKLNGNINSDNEEFKLNFKSEEIAYKDNYFENINLLVDNKNPLYNTYIEIDSIKNKLYNLSEFSMINTNAKDTLFFRTEFKGGKKGQDFYNLNLYHTIDANKNSVVGLQRSELNFKNYLWFLNENNENDNKIVFDKSLQNFYFENIKMTHEEQVINLLGEIRGKNFKDLELFFKDVNIGKLLPDSEGLVVDGVLNGNVNFKQNNEEFRPQSTLEVSDLIVNNIALGNLDIEVKGDDTFRKFLVNSTLTNKDIESFNLVGSLEIVNKETQMDLDLRLNDFNIGAFSNAGGDVISNIRGLVSGTSNFYGTLSEPEMNGRLFLKNAGLTVPYLNVDYELDKNSVVDLTEKQFLFRNIGLTDTKFNTKGVLAGNIRHNKLTDWKLDLEISSDYLVVLDTKDTEDAIYYGRAFIDGNASLMGPINGLLIDVEAKSMKGTAVKIPISDTQSVGENNFIHFVTSEELLNNGNDALGLTKRYNGLELNFDLTLTDDADIEVILNKETGHSMHGKGFGLVSLQINTLGKFNMFGEYQIYDGEYNFNYKGLFNKKFTVKKFGSINWEGDPMRARLNLEASYMTNANPAVLLENASFNKKVPVEVSINITGNLSNPEPDFNINFPTVSSVMKSEIQTKLSDKEARQTQALYLLASGGFLSPEGGISQNTLVNNALETAGGIFGNIFNDEDGKITISPEVTSVDRTPGKEADGTIGFNTSFKINDRISVNGKFGVPYGGINDAAVVGDVEILYRVNEDGTLNARVFNRENDITYIGEAIGYTQGIGLSYQVDFDTFKELMNKIFRNAKFKEEKNSSNEIPDSDFSPEFIQFTEQKNKMKAKPKLKVNAPTVPEID